MRKTVPIIALFLLFTIVGSVFAQVTYTKAFFTSYTVANLGTDTATVLVNYYNQNGVKQAWEVSRQVLAGGSVTLQQAVDDPSLASGQYSAVVSSDQPIAAIVNQQLMDAGSRSSFPPFSSYSGSSAGSLSVTIPSVMYNWYGYYTDFYIQNVGGGAAANIQIQYIPTTIGACTTGKAFTQDVTPGTTTVAQYATTTVSQLSMTNLGAAAAAGCGSFTGRFLGMAKITSDQEIVVVVNQNVQNKLFTYNGATTQGTDLIVPAYMRNWYGYYASITIANPGGTDASVTMTYIPGAGSTPSTQTQAVHTVKAGKSINIYDGQTATASQSDLVGKYPYNGNYTVTKQPLKFFGTIKIHSTQPILAMVNQEAELAAGNQAGSYNVPLVSEGTKKISVPLIQSDYYGYYTSLTIMTVDGTEATVKITYTSDADYSTKKSASKSYTLTTTNGFLNRYEGPTCTVAQCDLYRDTFWDAPGSTQGRFLGSAIIEVTSGSSIVAIVNSESTTAPNAATTDSMYSFNTINIAP